MGTWLPSARSQPLTALKPSTSHGSRRNAARRQIPRPVSPGRRRFASRYSLLPTPPVKSTKRSPSTLRQGHERFGSASKTEPSSSTSPARQRSANHPSFARSFRRSTALNRTPTRISPSFDSYLIPKLIVYSIFRNKIPHPLKRGATTTFSTALWRIFFLHARQIVQNDVFNDIDPREPVSGRNPAQSLSKAWIFKER